MSFLPLQAQNFSLSGAGCSVGDAVLNLKSFRDILGAVIAMTDLGAKAYLTLEPGNGTQEEQVSFTGVTQNSDGTAQLTGISTVLFKSPYTEASGFRVTHPGSVVAILSNTSGFYNQFGILSDNEAILGNWTAPDPTALQGIATQNYVLNTVSTGGTIKLDGIVPAATAGDTVSAGNMVYLRASDAKWYLTKGTDPTTLYGVQIGVVQSTAASGSAIAKGVLTAGYDNNQSGLVQGLRYYASDTPGAIGLSPGTNTLVVGNGGQSGAKLYFNPYYSSTPTPAQANYLATVTGTAVPYLVATGTASALTATYASALTTYASGTHLNFLVPVTNATGVTLNVNSIGPRSLVKNISSVLASGDIVRGQVVGAVYDGTNFQVTTPLAGSIAAIASGSASKDLSGASAAQTIAHGLGTVPKTVRICGMLANSTTSSTAYAAYTATGGSTATYQACDFTTTAGASGSGFVLYGGASGVTNGYFQTGVVTVDATNITITWTKSGASPTGNATLVWDAMA